ncbi:MAG: hypothetical protein HYV15_02265, partial [Elusimicrobia bacterium]|nr:hypothetical protein [Elusimicrobiota bacterium]
DGDGQFPFESIFSCLLRIETEDLDLVKTYRVRRDDGLYRTLVSVAYNALFRLLFGGGLRAVNAKPKIFRRDKCLLMGLKADDWFTDAEIVIRAKELGLRMAEVPIHFYAIDQRSSFVTPGAILEFVANLWRYRFRRPAARASEPRGDEILRP